MFHPVSILGLWLRGLLSVAVIVTAGMLFVRWYDRLPKSRIRDEDSVARQAPVALPEKLGPAERIVSWRPGLDATTAVFARATLLSLIALGGGAWAYPFFRPSSDDEPSAHRIGRKDRLRQPDGTELNIEEYGKSDGLPIIFTHGWGVDSTEWYYMKKELAADFRLVLWDLPGMGLSTCARTQDYSVTRFAADLQAIIDWTGSAQVVLVGHSLGGMIVQQFASAAESRSQLAGLVLVHTTYTNPVRTTKNASLYTAIERPVLLPLLHLTIALSPLVWLMNWAAYLNGSAHRSTERQSFSGAETRGQLRFVAAFFPRQSPAVLARAMLEMLRFDVTAILPTIEIPTLVIFGEHDPVTLPAASHHLADSLPRAKQGVLRKGRHQGHLEFHKSFAGLVRYFVRSHCASESSSDKRSPHFGQQGLRLHRDGQGEIK